MAGMISEIDRTYGEFVNFPHETDRKNRCEKNRLGVACDEAKTLAKKTFAGLNGWKIDRGPCDPVAIGRRNRRWLDSGKYRDTAADGLFDHCIGFRANGVNVALVTQPYRRITPENIRFWAVTMGLAIHIPPDPLASFHYPGHTYFIVITKAGEDVKWLSDQDGRLANRWGRLTYD